VTDRDRTLGQNGFSPSPSRRTVLIALGVLLGFILADHGLMVAVQAWRWPPLVEAMRVLTWLGYGAVDIGVFLVLALSGWWRGDRGCIVRGLAGGVTVAGAGLLDQILKNVACRARPTAPEAGSFFVNFPCFPARYAEASFPSGHATTAFAAAILLALWYPRARCLFLGLAGMVALSRILLGSHFPSDVLAGALLGSVVALAVYAYVPAARRNDAVSGARPG